MTARRGDGEGEDGAPMDAERDAHLREALRHAPDAAATPPAAVSASILRQARLAAAAGAAATPSSAGGKVERAAGGRDAARRGMQRSSRPATGFAARSASFWAWLMQPSVATGFAGLMVATLVGVMWWGRPIDEPLREAQAPEAAPTPATAPAPATDSAPATPAAAAPALSAMPAPAPPKGVAAEPPVADREARQSTLGKADASAPAAAPGREQLALGTRNAALAASRGVGEGALPKSAEAGEAKAEATTPQRQPRVDAEVADSSLRDTAELTKTRPLAASRAPAAAIAQSEFPAAPKAQQAPATAPAPTATATPRPDPAPAQAAAKATAPPPAIDSAPAVAEAAVPAERRRSESASGGAEPAERLADTAGASAASTASGSAPVSAAAPASTIDNPLQRLRAAVAADPEGWTWQRGGGAEQPMTPALQAWLGQLAGAAPARWQAPAASSGSGQALRLLSNGRLQATVRLAGDTVQVETAGAAGAAGAAAPGVARASLPAGAAAALRAALEQAAP